MMKGKLRQSITPEVLAMPFVNNVMYFDVTNRRMTWTYHIERTVAKALRAYIRTSYDLCLSHP
jgi:hypothetical protein